MDINLKEFFEDVLRQDKQRLRTYFCDDAVIRWHCSNEIFSLEEYIRANCDYPNEWNGEIERIEIAGDTRILAARVFPTDLSCSFHVVSFIQLKTGRISVLDEYWADDGDAPDWRKAMQIGKPIRQITTVPRRSKP